ncbi:MAG: hypothetical protein SF172_16470 [Burkholderiales bacterium]|nr:hypothetical protein [Burkholderiales bacterium]
MKSAKKSARPPSHALILSEEDGIRFLHFGTPWVQGAMRISRPTELVLDYTQDMMAALLLNTGGRSTAWPRTALQIGLGTASLTKFLQRHRPQCRQTIVEIDPRVVRLAEQSFRLRWSATSRHPGDAGWTPKAVRHGPETRPKRGLGNIHIEQGDGVAWLKASEETFDLILIDGFDADAKPGKLNGRSFYAHCRDRLSNNGVLVVNLLRRRSGMRLGVERILDAFDNRVVALPETEDGNTIVFATAGRPVRLSLAQLARRAAALRSVTGLDLAPLLTRMRAAGLTRIEL